MASQSQSQEASNQVSIQCKTTYQSSPDEKLGKCASAYVTAVKSPANTRSLQCSTVLSIAGLSSNAIGRFVNQICTSPWPRTLRTLRRTHLTAVALTNSKSQRFNLAEHRVLSLQGLRRHMTRRVHCFSLRTRVWADVYHSHFLSNSKLQTTIYLPYGVPLCCTMREDLRQHLWRKTAYLRTLNDEGHS